MIKYVFRPEQSKYLLRVLIREVDSKKLNLI